jgi:hypothetical protein
MVQSSQKLKSRSCKIELPDDIFDIIMSYFLRRNIYYTFDEIRHCAKDNLDVYLAFCRSTISRVKDLGEIFYLLKKYSCYQDEYELEVWRGNIYYQPPILIDVLFTGCNFPYSYSTFGCFSKVIFSDAILHDIKKIIKLIPSCLDCTFGQLRCRSNVTPLYAACINDNIPFHVIKLLLKSGADRNCTILVNGYPCKLLADLKGHVSERRYSRIVQLFEQV